MGILMTGTNLGRSLILSSLALRSALICKLLADNWRDLLWVDGTLWLWLTREIVGTVRCRCFKTIAGRVLKNLESLIALLVNVRVNWFYVQLHVTCKWLTFYSWKKSFIFNVAGHTARVVPLKSWIYLITPIG